MMKAVLTFCVALNNKDGGVNKCIKIIYLIKC